MINKLTEKQIQLMSLVQNEWIDKLNTLQFDEQKAKESIKWLYKQSGLKEPKIICVDSPFSCQLMVNKLDDIGRPVHEEIGEFSWNFIFKPVWKQTREQVTDNVWARIKNPFQDLDEKDTRNIPNLTVISNHVWHCTKTQIENQLKIKKLKYYSFSKYFNIIDYPQLTYYNYFNRIGVKYKNQKEFDEVLFLINSGIYDMIQFEKVCVICKLPKKIYINENKQVHNDTDYAIQWNDGYKVAFIDGVYIDYNLFGDKI